MSARKRSPPPRAVKLVPTMSEEATEAIVTALFFELPSLEPAVSEHMAGCILTEIASIKTPVDLEHIIGEWIASEASPSEIKPICQNVFKYLQNEDLIPGKVEEPLQTIVDDDEEDVAASTNTGDDDDDDDDEDEEEEEMLKDGECELCEREMPLTKHHVIPRELHERYVKKGYKKKVLNQGIYICRPCHNAVHKFFDHKTLASKYNTVETLMSTEQMQKWVPYIRKQKTRSKRNQQLPYRK